MKCGSLLFEMYAMSWKSIYNKLVLKMDELVMFISICSILSQQESE